MIDLLLIKRLPLVCTVLLLILTVEANAQSSSAEPAIESIEIATDNGDGEKVVIRLNSSYSPKSFRLDGERPRLVFDFVNVRYLPKANRVDGAGGPIVSGVRIGRHKDPLKTRVVIDINSGALYQYNQTFNVSNNSLEIIFLPADPEDIERIKHQYIRAERVKIVHGPASEIDSVEKEDTVEKENKQETAEEKQKTDEKKLEPPTEVAVLEADQQKRKIEVGSVEEAEEPQQTSETDVDTDVDTEADTEVDTVVEADEKTGETAEDASETVSPADDPGETPDPPIILDVSFEKSINNSETVLFKLNHFHPPLVFGIEQGAPRVVCDFLDGEISPDVPAVIDAGGKYVNRITVSNQVDPKKVRVELELVANQHYDLQQLFFKEDSLFVVIVNELAE